jgi:histidyl-tRNA synthetase
MVEEKGLDAEIADRIGEYVKLKGTVVLIHFDCSLAVPTRCVCVCVLILITGQKELCAALLKDDRLGKNKRSVEGLEQMRTLFEYLEVYGVLDRVSASDM